LASILRRSRVIEDALAFTIKVAQLIGLKPIRQNPEQ
jgi:hypothetical protein